MRTVGPSFVPAEPYIHCKQWQDAAAHCTGQTYSFEYKNGEKHRIVWKPPRKSGLTLKTIEAVEWLYNVRPSP